MIRRTKNHSEALAISDHVLVRNCFSEGVLGKLNSSRSILNVQMHRSKNYQLPRTNLRAQMRSKGTNYYYIFGRQVLRPALCIVHVSIKNEVVERHSSYDRPSPIPLIFPISR